MLDGSMKEYFNEEITKYGILNKLTYHKEWELLKD